MFCRPEENFGRPAHEHVFVGFECISCELLVEWSGKIELFVCPNCGYELTSGEACEVVDRAEDLLARLRLDIGLKERRGRWDSVRRWLVCLLLGRSRSY